MLIVAPFVKGTTINKNKRLDHELLRSPETEILKYHEYKINLANYSFPGNFFHETVSRT